MDEGFGVHEGGGEVEGLESGGAEVFEAEVEVFGEGVVG